VRRDYHVPVDPGKPDVHKLAFDERFGMLVEPSGYIGGTVIDLEVHTPSADTYLQHHGRVVIMSGKFNTNTEYRWGGTSCGTRTLSDAMVALLQRALESGTPIVLRFQIGQGMAKCLVGFKFAP
jgi:hypothetical protein